MIYFGREHCVAKGHEVLLCVYVCVYMCVYVCASDGLHHLHLLSNGTISYRVAVAVAVVVVASALQMSNLLLG